MVIGIILTLVIILNGVTTITLAKIIITIKMEIYRVIKLKIFGRK
jgi:hypothetical protein